LGHRKEERRGAGTSSCLLQNGPADILTPGVKTLPQKRKEKGNISEGCHSGKDRTEGTENRRKGYRGTRGEGKAKEDHQGKKGSKDTMDYPRKPGGGLVANLIKPEMREAQVKTKRSGLGSTFGSSGAFHRGGGKCRAEKKQVAGGVDQLQWARRRGR